MPVDSWYVRRISEYTIFPLQTVYMKEIKVSLSKMFYIRSASPFACYISHVQKLNFGNSGFTQNSQKKH